jgi:hypothetical protein
MKTRMFQDLEAKGKNWHKELPSILWALQTNVSRANRATPFSLVYGVKAVLPPEVYLESTRVAHFNSEDQGEARELDANLLEERRVVQRELNIRDLVLKKDIRTKDNHKFSTHWEGSFIIVDVTASGAYVLAEVDAGMLPNTLNIDQLHKYYV